MKPEELAFPSGGLQVGLTKREWYAGLAMQSIVGIPIKMGMSSSEIPNVVAETAFSFADAMICEGSKAPEILKAFTSEELDQAITMTDAAIIAENMSRSASDIAQEGLEPV